VGVEIYAAFCGDIDGANTTRLMEFGADVTNPRTDASHLHLLFQSYGGDVGMGVSLYNFFRNYPLPLTIYNGGSVVSIATVAYLGAKKRTASAYSTFVLHRTMLLGTGENANRSKVARHLASMTIDDQRTDAILRAHLTLSESQWSDLDQYELVFSSQGALGAGIATEIGEFSPPSGTRIHRP
jgi:ATP-dependent Clp protease protease subunit